MLADKFQNVVEQEIARRVEQKVHAPVEITVLPWWRKAARLFTSRRLSTIEEATNSAQESRSETPHRGRSTASRVRPDMIRRMDDAPKLINPSGNISENQDSSRPRDEQQVPSTAASVSETTEAEVTRELEELESDDSIAREK